MAAATFDVSMMELDVCSNGGFYSQKDLMHLDDSSYEDVCMMDYSTSSGVAQSSFNVFPEELVYEVFTFLHGSDICNTAQKVCRSWRRLARDDRLWCDLLKKAHNPEEDEELQKPAHKTWKWLYQSKYVPISSLDNLKGREGIVGRYEADEYIYEGDWKDAKHSGYGRKIFKNKSEGEQKEANDHNANNNANANQVLEEDNAQTTSSDADQASARRARPVKKRPTLSYYEGEWADGKEHGRGKRVFEDDHYYVGEWKEGEREGFGFYHWPNKTFYEGEFKEGFRHGQGTYTWSEKAKYIGQWHKGIEHGKGVRTWADGDKYEGDWVHGTRTGSGLYTWPNGSSYEGKWLQCAHEGYGVYRWPDGRVYKGNFMNNKKHGLGEYYWPDGASFSGLWKSGVRHGEGTMTWPDRSRFVGEWNMDRRVTGRYFTADSNEVSNAMGSSWTKKYDYYFAMPMEMWEQMYLPEINRLIQERKACEEQERTMKQAESELSARMQQSAGSFSPSSASRKREREPSNGNSAGSRAAAMMAAWAAGGFGFGTRNN